jgi:hypothetical protein
MGMNGVGGGNKGGGTVSGSGKGSFGGGVGGAKCSTKTTNNNATKTTTAVKSCGIAGFKSIQGIDTSKFSADKLSKALDAKTSTPSAKAVANMEKTAKTAAATGYKSVSLDKFLDPKKASNAPAAVVIGNAEGNRTPKGGTTPNYKTHTDPGDKKRNMGSFSYNPRGSGKVAKTPQKADTIYLKELNKLKTNYKNKVTAAGLDPYNSLLASTYFDAATQSPRAANKMLNQIDHIKKNGITPDTMKQWRFRGYVDMTTGQRWGYSTTDKTGKTKTTYAGSGFDKGKMSETQIQIKIRQDQLRRADAITNALDAQGFSLNTP